MSNRGKVKSEEPQMRLFCSKHQESASVHRRWNQSVYSLARNFKQLEVFLMTKTKKRIFTVLLAATMVFSMAMPAFAATPPYNQRVWIYNVANPGPNLNADCATSPTNHTNVTMWQITTSNTQRWDLQPIDATKNLFYIRNYANTSYALNLYPPQNNNCDLYPIAANDYNDCAIKCVDEGSDRYGIVLPAYALCLTPTGYSNGNNVNWQSSNGQNNQLWRIRVNRT